MNTQTMDDASLEDRIKKLETHISLNPYSSTLEKEQLEELKQEKLERSRNKQISY